MNVYGLIHIHTLRSDRLSILRVIVHLIAKVEQVASLLWCKFLWHKSLQHRY